MGNAQIKPKDLNWSVRKVKFHPDIGRADQSVASMVGLSIKSKVYLWGTHQSLSGDNYQLIYTVYQNGNEQFADIEVAKGGKKISPLSMEWVVATQELVRTNLGYLPKVLFGALYRLLCQRKPDNG